MGISKLTEIKLAPLSPLEPEPPPRAIRWQTPVPAHWFIDFEEGRHFHVEPAPSREARFNALRAEGKKLGEINAILEAEGFSEVSGEGVMPCPTKSHEIVRENKGAKQMIGELP